MERAQTLYDITTAELAARLRAMGEPAYRAQQVRRWAFREYATSYEEMTDLPAALRRRLAAELPLGLPEETAFIRSDDGLTRKSLLRLRDGELIEAVLMLYDPRSEARGSLRRAIDRATACLSTQAGCAMGCVFCATGQAGFRRNLTVGEIIAQAVRLSRHLKDEEGRRLTNVVFMGMGEPLANYEATLRAVRTINARDGFGIAARSITISTVGMLNGIRRLADEGLQVGLAVSLHAPDDDLRQRLIPTQRHTIAELLDAVGYYVERTGRRVTFEYVLMEGVNDAPEQSDDLGRLLKGLLCHVNLIPVNPTEGSAAKHPARGRLLAFQKAVARHGVACTVRVERGVEIAAACGQLRGEHATSLRRAQRRQTAAT